MEPQVPSAQEPGQSLETGPALLDISTPKQVGVVQQVIQVVDLHAVV